MQGTFNKSLLERYNMQETKSIVTFFENGRFCDWPSWGSYKINEDNLRMEYDNETVIVSENICGYFIGQNEEYSWTIKKCKTVDKRLGVQTYFNQVFINGEPDCFIKFFTNGDLGHSWWISGLETLKFTPQKWRDLLTIDSLTEFVDEPTDSNKIVEQVNGKLRFVHDKDEWTMTIEDSRGAIEAVADLLEKYLKLHGPA